MLTRITPEQQLSALGIELPAPSAPVAAYIPTKRSGSLLFISGQVPFSQGKLTAVGPVPSAVTPEAARQAARQCALNGLAAARAELGSLDRVSGVVRIGVFVQSDDGFTEQPRIANGASELLVQIFGESGRHTRAAVGVNALPLGASVEVELVLEVG